MTKPLPEDRQRAYRPRRTFTPAFRAKAVALAMQGTQTLAAIARDLDLNPGLLHNWVRFHKGDPAPHGIGGDGGKPLAHLVEQLRPENLAKFHAGKPKSHHKKAKETTAITLSSVPAESALQVTQSQLALPILEKQDHEPCQRLKRVAVRSGLSMAELVNSLMELAMVEGVKRGR